MLTVSSRTKTDTGRRTRIGVLTVDDASPLPRVQKERRGTAKQIADVSATMPDASLPAAKIAH
jgi:hypothetical protein